MADGAALALGSRYIPGGSIPDWSWHRRALSRWGNRYAAAVLGIDVKDATSGYRAYRAEALTNIDFHTVQADGYGFQVEMAYRVLASGGRIVEVPISFTDRVRRVEDVKPHRYRGPRACHVVGHPRPILRIRR